MQGRGRRPFTVAILMAVAAALLHGEARACSVPVFRWALERWKPSPYQVHVFHRGALTDAQTGLVKRLQDASANLQVATIDLDGEPGEEQAALWKLHGREAALPWVIVSYPEGDADATPASAGQLDEANIGRLLDSPARQRLVRLLSAGESAVWVLLESGDAKADAEAARMLEAELARLRRELKLPEQDEKDQLTDLPLTLSFPVLRVSRADAREADFVRLLLGTDDLDGAAGPLVFPVFGRGRVLLGMHGERLRPAQIERWASFLCGPCSCRVKELNPGVDLLLTADWEELLDLEDAPPPVKPSIAAPEIPPGPAAQEAPEEEPSDNRWLALTLGGAGLLVVLTAAMLLRDRRAPC
jgi:hypothetical protein